MSSRTKPITDEEAAFWSDIRKQFYLKNDVTYLQGGSVGPSARPIVERVIDLMREVAAAHSHLPLAAMLVSKLQAAQPSQVTNVINIQDSVISRSNVVG